MLLSAMVKRYLVSFVFQKRKRYCELLHVEIKSNLSVVNNE